MQWSEEEWWPQRNTVRYFAPTNFKAQFSTTRVIVDGTECPIQKPNSQLHNKRHFPRIRTGIP